MQINREETLQVITREVTAFFEKNREAANNHVAVAHAIQCICDEAYKRGDIPAPLDVYCEYDPEDRETYYNLYLRPDPPPVKVECKGDVTKLW